MDDVRICEAGASVTPLTPACSELRMVMDRDKIRSVC